MKKKISVVIIVLFMSFIGYHIYSTHKAKRDAVLYIDNTEALGSLEIKPGNVYSDAHEPKAVKCGSPQKLSPARLVVRFDDKYPVGLDVIDSLLYVIMVRSDTAVYVYNKHTLGLCKSFGYVGRGPQDVLSPNFLKNNYEVKRKENVLEFYDVNARKIFKNVGEGIIPTKEFVAEMYPADQLNISGDYWIGRMLHEANNGLFEIYNAKTHEYTSIDLYPEIPDLDEKIDKSRLYSVVLACNKSYNKIVVGMYYFDLILLYNFEGKLLHTLTISENYKTKKALQNMLDGDEYIGYSQIYATDNCCYLRRYLKGGEGNRKRKGSHIVRMDWKGNILGIYYMDEYTTADFCVDETAGEIYCISQSIDNEEEYYDIVSYKL